MFHWLKRDDPVVELGIEWNAFTSRQLDRWATPNEEPVLAALEGKEIHERSPEHLDEEKIRAKF